MMKNIRFQCVLALWMISLLPALAQEKRALTHADYDRWETISFDRMTKDGKWIGYEVNPQDGDGRLEIVATANSQNRFVIPRANRLGFSHNGQYAVGRIVAQKDSVRYLKLKKTKPDDMPKDSLFVLDLGSGTMEKFSRVKSFSMPVKEGNWLAIQFEKELPEKAKKKDPADTTQNNNVKDKPKKTDGTKLLVKSLGQATSYEFARVKSFGFNETGTFLYYTLAEEDTLKNTGLFILDLITGISKPIDERKTEYIGVAFSPRDKFLSFLTTEDSAKAKKPYYDLYLYEIAKANNQKVAGKSTPGINGMVSKNGSLSFSEDETKLFFGTAPDYVSYTYEDDTTILDEERVKLDIWSWQEDEIQPMQLKNRSRAQNKSYLAAYQIKSRKIIPLADDAIADVSLDRKSKFDYALGFDSSPYRRNYSWDIQIGRDLYLVDLATGAKTLVKNDVPGSPQLSPAGKYIYWYDSRDSAWVSYEIKKGTFANLTKAIPSAFYDELHDSPSLPSSYGAAGWLKDDAGFLVYDRFDIWKVDPTGKKQPVNITQSEGKGTGVIFRRERLDLLEEGIDPAKPLILEAFDEKTKKSGFFVGDFEGKTAPREVIFSDHRYTGLQKAENADIFSVRRSTYNEFPDVYITDFSMKNLTKISSANPQQAQVKWGSVELVAYLANDGTPLQGLLFKPENFDASKKYPMLVYFYERNSDGLHSYRAPAPSASTINIPYFVSNGYLVFVPDIKYDLGLPGPSAYNCIIPGVQSLVARGFVDASNMAIQGQSWGGYQVAYLITQTNMFKAAGAGAPVVNMTSAYGGIRWGTGMSRMFQYEQAQSRIGGTLWEKPLYYLENSPLFFMDRVNTPVLIMHNDEDGAVPWYQGIEMFMALKRLNKPAWLLQYNGEDHNLVQRKNRKDLSIRLAQFFDHYLKGAPAPLWMTEGLPAVEKGRTLKYELSDR
jgi:dipeptidyl aminopeptidase/acylaminoacyl peptidase